MLVSLRSIIKLSTEEVLGPPVYSESVRTTSCGAPLMIRGTLLAACRGLLTYGSATLVIVPTMVGGTLNCAPCSLIS